MRMVKLRILPPQPIHLKPQDLFFRFLTKYSFLTIDLVHEPSRAILYGLAVLISDDVPIDPQGNSWVAVPQLPLVVACGSASFRCQRFVDMQSLRVTGYRCAGGVRLFDEIVSVIGEDGSGCARRFVDAATEGVVFDEADRSAAAGQRDASQPVFEVPCIRCRTGG